MTTIVHLMASPFLGGPEKQMLGLAAALPGEYRSVFLSFAERGLCRPLLDAARRQGFDAFELRYNVPRFRASVREVADHLRRQRADVLLCSGYKPDILGLFAARRAGIPAIGIAHGWTAATWKVRCNEMLDRLCLRWMDRVVCVSAKQAERVRAAGIAAEKIVVICNAVNFSDETPDPSFRRQLEEMFPRPPRHIVAAAGRLSPEKGLSVLVDAAAIVTKTDSGVGFVLFGNGPLKAALAAQIASKGLRDRVVLAGFRPDLQRFLPWIDVLALSSFTEGLPVIVLEALAAGKPMVATAVGGTPEVIEDGRSGFLVPPGDPAALARKLSELLRDGELRRSLGEHGRERMREQFTFAAQAAAYQRLFASLQGTARRLRQPAMPV
jgi:glycosyltransferase involved in cell wall biosynthesis